MKIPKRRKRKPRPVNATAKRVENLREHKAAGRMTKVTDYISGPAKTRYKKEHKPKIDKNKTAPHKRSVKKGGV